MKILLDQLSSGLHRRSIEHRWFERQRSSGEPDGADCRAGDFDDAGLLRADGSVEQSASYDQGEGNAVKLLGQVGSHDVSPKEE